MSLSCLESTASCRKRTANDDCADKDEDCPFNNRPFSAGSSRVGKPCTWREHTLGVLLLLEALPVANRWVEECCIADWPGGALCSWRARDSTRLLNRSSRLSIESILRSLSTTISKYTILEEGDVYYCEDIRTRACLGRAAGLRVIQLAPDRRQFEQGEVLSQRICLISVYLHQDKRCAWRLTLRLRHGSHYRGWSARDLIITASTYCALRERGGHVCHLVVTSCQIMVWTGGRKGRGLCHHGTTMTRSPRIPHPAAPTIRALSVGTPSPWRQAAMLIGDGDSL